MCGALAHLPAMAAAEEAEETELKLFDGAVFYDGYLLENNPDSLLDDGILRHSCSLYAVRLTDGQLDQIGTSLRMDVSVGACCDNYDRIGNINLAFVPKGRGTYSTDSVARIEIGRFITPFMDKNKKPDSVPYSYDLPYVSDILRDSLLRSAFDIWVEFELFGVPYAANQQVAGCSGRSDVFKGYLSLFSSKPAAGPTSLDVLVPIAMKKPEYIGGNLNNYSEQGTDTIGKTTKTWLFDVPCDVSDGQIVLVTSNHGANEDGEEYNRRWHYVYIDDELALSYKPGRESCEPFREYNTQLNGIYGRTAKTDEEWQSFSNWCPGDVIDNRIISLGAVKQGSHKIRISVPEAEFAGKQGDIPVSIFFQGLKEGEFSGISAVPVASTDVSIGIDGRAIRVDSSLGVPMIEICDMQGRLLLRRECSREATLPDVPQGMYLVHVELSNGIIATRKIILK